MGELMNTDTIKDKIRERIQKEFVELIPEEAWKALVAGEIKWFMEDTSSGGYRQSGPSPLRDMIRTELTNRFKEDVKKELDSMQGSWDPDGKMIAGEAVKELVKGIAPELWELAVAGVVQKAIEGFRIQMS